MTHYVTEIPTAHAGNNHVPPMCENKYLRATTIILLYFMQGIVAGISLIAIPAWLAARGASPIEVGGIRAAAAWFFVILVPDQDWPMCWI